MPSHQFCQLCGFVQKAFQSLLMTESVKRQRATMVFLRDCLYYNAARPHHFTASIFDLILWWCCLYLLAILSYIQLALVSCKTMCSGTHTFWLSGNCGRTVLQHRKAVCLSNTSPDLFSFIAAGSLCLSERVEEPRIMRKMRYTCLLSVAANASAQSASREITSASLVPAKSPPNGICISWVRCGDGEKAPSRYSSHM